MTCEININTSAVWSIGNYLKSNGRTNYDTLWRDINNLDSALDSLRSYNNPSGSVSSLVDSAQQSLGRCRSYCIEPTSNAMNNLASFLQSAAVQYEQTEREVCNIWGNRITSNSIDVGNAFGNLFDTLRRGAESAFDHVADFMGDLIDDTIVNKWDSISKVLDIAFDAIVVAGIFYFALFNPVGWVVFGAFVIATAYKYATGGNSIVGDALALGAELAGADKSTVEKWRGYGKDVQAVGELFLPGGGVAKVAGKAAGMAGKIATGAEKGGNLLVDGGKVFNALRKPTETIGLNMRNYSIGKQLSDGLLGKNVSKTSPFVASYGGALVAKEKPVNSMIHWVNRETKYSPISSSVEKSVSKGFDSVTGIKDSADAVTTLYDSATDERRKPESERGYNNALSNAWHSCFG